MKRAFCLLLCATLFFSLLGCAKTETDDNDLSVTISRNPSLCRGVNLSALEDKLKPHTFLYNNKTYVEIAEKGFDHVRLPVDFRNYCNADGVVSGLFYKKLDNIIEMANDNGLKVMLDFHGWYDLNVNNGDARLFLNIWKDVAEHYKDYPNSLIFELINEPHTTDGGDLDMWMLMKLQDKAIEQIREIDPERTIVIAVSEWNGPHMLKDLEMPDYDNLIVAVHTYEPLDFTHQGQAWAGTKDVKLELTDEMLNSLTQQLNLITEFKARTGCEVVLNEFGLTTTGHISDEDVSRYLSCITKYAKEHDIPWTYWCYSDSFGVYDRGFFGIGGKWRQNVLDALMV